VLVLDVPPARSFVLNLAENGVELGVWGWVKNVDYWRTRGDLLEKIKLRFDQEGITVPFPQREVHLNRQAPPATDKNGS
jgi:small conductance mechanosensitive channel